jgi:hypothetical protein
LASPFLAERGRYDPWPNWQQYERTTAPDSSMRRIADHPYWTTAGPGQTVTGFVREGGFYPIASLGTYAANTATTATTWT